MNTNWARVLPTTLLTALASCTPQWSWVRTRGPDGRPAIAVRCERPLDCYRIMGEQCGNRGYDVVSSSSAVLFEAVQSGSFGKAKTSKTIDVLIECKPPRVTE